MQVIVANGELYTKLPVATALTTRTVPTGVTLKTPRPCATKLRRAGFINGRYSPAVVYRDDLDVFYKAGVAPPTAGPTLANGGVGKLTGQSIAFYTWIQKDVSGNIITESGASPPAGDGYALVHNKQTRVWTTPTTAPDARVTHKGLYVSWNGADPRHVMDLELATASVTEDMSALEFGRVMEEGGDIVPYGVYCETFQQRVFAAGIIEFPDRIYFSNFGDAESWNLDNYLKTTSGKAVTGIKRLGETLVIFTHTTTDIIVGNSPDTFTIIPRDPTIGCISHHGIVNMFNRLWFPSSDGIRTYDGSFRYLMENLRDYWHDEYEADPTAYESSFAEVDFDTHSYLLTLNKASTFRYVGYYLPFEPAVGGGEGNPWWFIDTRVRKDTAMGRLTYAAGSMRTRLITGSADGYLRRENVVTNVDDDGDVGQKEVLIQPKHLLMNDPSGDPESGKQLVKLHSYIESEDTGWTIEARGGDESAENTLNPEWYETVAASAESYLQNGVSRTAVAKVVHNHDEVEKVTGRGFTLKYRATSPKNFKWRGFGGVYSSTGPGDFRGNAT